VGKVDHKTNLLFKSQNQNLEKMFMKIGSGSLGHKGNYFTKVNYRVELYN